MTTTFAQLSLWDEQEELCRAVSHQSGHLRVHYIQVIYFGGQREVYRVGSPEWEKVARDMNVWSAEFVKGEGR